MSQKVPTSTRIIHVCVIPTLVISTHGANESTYQLLVGFPLLPDCMLVSLMGLQMGNIHTYIQIGASHFSMILLLLQHGIR